MIRRLLLVAILLVILAAGAVLYSVGLPYKGYGQPVFVDIAQGTSTAEMARLLTREGVVRSEWQFLLARMLQRGAKLQAGEYRFERPLSAWQVLDKIARGDVFYYELRVPEGANMFDVAAELQKLGLMKAETFLAAARNPALVRDIAPEAPTLEGYLFPSTYRITRGTKAAVICREMTSQFRRVWRSVAKGGEDVNRAVTLASLVEKETGVPTERPTVASVYHNRLRSGMKLDCDPTTIYAAMLEGRYRGKIYRSDLDNPHPYNTYRNPGLPPGAIANPGAESLRAALQPAETSYLFFVAKVDGSGGHIFSETLGAHNAAVRDYRSALTQ